MAISFLPRQPQQRTEHTVLLEAELAAALDRWRMDQNPAPSLEQAIGDLAKRALILEGYVTDQTLASAEDERVNTLLAAFEAAARRD